MKIIERNYRLFFILLLIISGCSGGKKTSEEPKANGQNTDPELIEGITYAILDTLEIKLNIALPADTSGQYPLLVFIHGGGWKTGHRSAYNKQIQNAAKRGYVAATITHRYTRTVDESGEPVYRWPAPIEDAKAAVRYLRANAGKYAIDPDKIGVLGASSGGHLSMMVGFTDNSHGLDGAHQIPGDPEGKTSARVQAVANISGPTELVSSYDAPIVTPFLDDMMAGSPEEYPEKYKEASPLTYLSDDDPPVFTVHGAKDDVVPVEQAYMLDEEMKKKGMEHEMKILEDQAHIFKGEAARDSWNAIYDFFDRKLKE